LGAFTGLVGDDAALQDVSDYAVERVGVTNLLIRDLTCNRINVLKYVDQVTARIRLLQFNVHCFRPPGQQGHIIFEILG
jgi:hypothetical protein